MTNKRYHGKIIGMLALFKSHFSIGKSILTLDNPITHKEGAADSIFTIAQENDLDKIVLVEDTMSRNFQNIFPKRIYFIKILNSRHHRIFSDGFTYYTI